MSSLWPAPLAPAPVHARVDVPGSKSHTNRALLLGALADGPSRLGSPLRARDTELMCGALQGLGVRIDRSDDSWAVTPGALHGTSVDTGLAGTVMRFVPPLAALAAGRSTFDGDRYARERPMSVLIDGLRQAGVEIDDRGTGQMPFTVAGSGSVRGGVVEIDSSASSQFVSALLLAGARYEKGIEVRHVGAAPVPSLPHIEMTVAALRRRGVQVDDSTAQVWRVAPGPVAALDEVIEPDLSNAAPFLAAALVTGGQVHIPRWPSATDQPGDALRALLTAMGAEITVDDTGLTLTGAGSITGVDADLHDVGELTPVLAAIAAVARTPSTFRGIAHLRGHETDRLAAIAANLSALGADVAQRADGLAITPRPLRGAVWPCYADHRMAQAGAVLGLVVAGVAVDDIASTGKTLPDFPGMWTAMLAGDAG